MQLLSHYTCFLFRLVKFSLQASKTMGMLAPKYNSMKQTVTNLYTTSTVPYIKLPCCEMGKGADYQNHPCWYGH